MKTKQKEYWIFLPILENKLRKAGIKVLLLFILVGATLKHSKAQNDQVTITDPLLAAQIKDAIVYLQGNDSVSADFKKAYKLFFDGAKQDNDFCMFMTGKMLAEGDGVQQNFKKAAEIDVILKRIFFRTMK